MRDWLRDVLRIDAVVPVVLIMAALLMTLEPTILGVTITERQIVLAFFGFLGIDTLIERTGRLRRIERRLDTLAKKASGPLAAGRCSVLATHSSGWMCWSPKPAGACSSSASTLRVRWDAPPRWHPWPAQAGPSGYWPWTPTDRL